MNQIEVLKLRYGDFEQVSVHTSLPCLTVA